MAMPVKNKSLITSRAKDLAAKRREEEEKKKQEEQKRQAMLERQEKRAQERQEKINRRADDLLNKKTDADQRPSYQQGTKNNYYNPNMPTKTPEEISGGKTQKSGNIWNGLPKRKSVAELLGERAGSLTAAQRQKVLDPIGQYGKGNIDLNNRKVARNTDGSISTEYSTTVGFDGKSYLIPTVVDGKVVSTDKAIDHFRKTGENLGVFDTDTEANTYAQMLHLRQEGRYRDEADKWAAQSAKEQEGKNNVLSTYGVPFAYNKDGGVVPVDAGKWDMNDRNNQYLQGRPEDYEGNEYDYDRAAYDWVHGIGEYDRRVEALDTDEDVDALDAEVKEIWDSVERSFREPRVFTKSENPQGYPHSYDMPPERPYKDYIGDVKIGGQERPMTPQEIYENANPKLRGQAADQLLSADMYQGWLNKNPFLKYANLAEDRAEWKNVQADTERVIEEGNEELQEALDTWEPGDPFYDNLIDEIKAGAMPDVISTPVRSEENDRALMDFYYGDGFYDEWEGDPEREEKLQELWAPIEDGSMAAYRDKAERFKDTQTETEYAMRMNRVAGKQLKENERLQAEADAYNELMNLYDGETRDPAFKAEYDKGTTNPNNIRVEVVSNNTTNDIHRIASFIGGGNELTSWSEAMFKDKKTKIAPDYQYSMMMTNDEKDVFIGLYNEDMDAGREPTRAREFLNGLQTYLKSRYEDAQNIRIEEVASKYPVVSSIVDLYFRQLNTYADIPRHIAHLFGDKSTEDPNSSWYFGTKFGDVSEATIAKNMGEVGGKIYSGVMNSASNLLRALAAPKGSKIAQTFAGLGGFFMQVDQEATARYLQNHDYEEAATMGAVDALFEVLEEFLPFETMLGTAGKGLIPSMAINSLSEAGQELAGATVGEKLKGLILGEDPEVARADEIVAQKGYEKDGKWVDLSWAPKDVLMDAANMRAAHEFWTQAAEQGLGGAFGGMLGGTYGTIMRAASLSRTGKNIRNERNTVDGVTGGEQMVTAAAGMDGTESQELAQKIQEKQENGKSVSNYEYGKLAATIAEESTEQIADITKQTLQTRIFGQLKQEGLKGEQAQKIAAAITKELTGEKLTAEERKAIGESKAGLELWRSYNSYTSEEYTGAVEEVNAATKDLQNVRKSIMDMMTEPENREMTPALTRAMMKGAEWLEGEALNDVQGELTGKATEVIADGEVAEVVGFGTKQVTDADGKKHTVATAKLANGEEVSIADIQATSEGTAKVLQFLQNEGGKSIGSNLGAKVLELSANVRDTARLMTDAVNVMWSEYLETGKVKTNLSAAEEEQLRQAVRADIQADDQKRMKARKEIRPGEGAVTFDGKEAGTEEYESALGELSGKIRKEAEYIADLMKSAGMNVEMYYDESESAKQGVFNGGENGNGIRINLAGTFNAQGLHRSAVATVAHEATHWLAANAPGAYRQMRTFTLQNLQKSGMNVQAELRGIMDNYELHGESLDLGGAIDEIVAMGYEQVLTNEQLVRDLKEQDLTLFGKVKQAVQKVIDRLRGIRNDAVMTSSRYARALMNVADRAAQIWGIAYREARDAEGEGTAAQANLQTEEAEEQAQYSFRDDTDYDVRQWMETVPEWSLQTEAEKTLLKKYGNLRRRTELDRERMRKIDRDLLNLEAQLVDERHGRIEAKETLENMLESAGVSVRDERWLQKDGKIIAKIEADGTFTMDRGADSKAYADMKAAGFMFNGRKVTYRTEALGAPTRVDGKPSISILLGKSEALRQRDALQKKKDDLQKKMDETEEELSRILSDEGFAQLMFRQNKVLEDIQNFKTQQELMDYVARMEKAANEIAERIEKNKKAVDALEKGGIVEKFRELLGSTSAEQAAADLKKEYHSTWTAKQIRAYLDPIILKMKTGADFQADVETLAGILVSTDSRNRYETLEELRGLTITLGKGAQQELKAQNSSLKEVRARLAGTGITVKYGERSTLEADIEDLRAEYPMIPELGDEKDALGNFLNWIDSMKSASAGMEFYDQRLAEAMAVVTGKAAGAAKGIYMPNNVKAQQQVMAMMNFVKSLNAETEEAQKALADVAKQMEAMQKTGMLASNKATTLMRDVNVALDYYNRISRIAVDEAKETKTSALIEQLKSKQAQEILKNNEEWRNLIQRDKEAREQLEDNRKHVRMINTNLKRMWKRLKAPKGTDNIPERMQGLAREVLGMFVKNDLGYGMRFLDATQDGLMEMQRVLAAWEAQDGKFDEEQLKDLADGVQESIELDLEKIREGLQAINQKLKGKNKKDFLEQRGAIIGQIQEGVSEIYTAIKAEQEVFSNGQKVKVEDAAYAVAQATEGKKYSEWTGTAGGAIRMLHKAIISGNMTPEYFFRTLGNAGLSGLWENYHDAENRNGLELKKAKDRLAKIAEEYGYDQWDMNQKITLNLESGDVEVTLGQLMSLWATWKREQTLGPAMSEHLTKGGFYAEKDLRAGFLGRAAVEKRAHTVTEEDMAKVKDLLTEEQRKFVDDVVGYMSQDMSELGNEASMKAYGIRLYKEAYYFPFQIWNGVKNRKSNEAGGAAAAQDRAFHPSFAKSRMHGANNAVMIGDFMTVAADHIAGMINYATMGLANESLMKVLNQQTTADAYGTKRNTEAILEEAYGREAMQYLRELQKQLNGGAVKIDKAFYDRLISLFRKNAVAGSLSVALQQPLSYLRAAMMIPSRYLVRAISPDVWKGSYKEMMQYSGVACIKEMGRFDMNFGASAREYLTPEGKEGKARKVWNWTTDKATILPELMDRMTWTRMWSAVKAEQHALNPGMDMKSEAFLKQCGERFNDVMRRTQVYDSVLVKSANMRNQHTAVKMLTSFMAEPTLTLNVLADGFRQWKQREKGGFRAAGKAATIFMISAALQAAIKGALSARRNPDEDKTWEENYWYRFWYSFWGEVDPLQLVPGYDEMATLLKGGEIKDDAFGSLSKMFTAWNKVMDLIRGDVDDAWKGVEDSVGQIAQMVTKLPVKNIMRDLRATYNWALHDPYAKRETSGAVLKYQWTDVMMTADTLLGIINTQLGAAGWETSTNAYIKRIYEAKKAGHTQDAQDMIDYLINGKGVKEKSVTSKIGSYAMDQYAEGNISREEAGEAYKESHPKAKDKDVLAALDKVDYEKENGDTDNYSNYTPMKDAMDAGDDKALKNAKDYLLKNGYTEKEIVAAMKSYITDQYRDGDITKQEAEKMLKKYRPEMSRDDIFWTLDLIDYKNETGNTDASGNYYRLKDAINAGKSDGIRKAVQTMLQHGYDQKKIKNWLANKDTGFKTAYLAAKGNEKIRIKNALIMVYKAIGISENEANRIINKWK